MFQTLPEKISTDEQRELLALLLKTNELEVENVGTRNVTDPTGKWQH